MVNTVCYCHYIPGISCDHSDTFTGLPVSQDIPYQKSLFYLLLTINLRYLFIYLWKAASNIPILNCPSLDLSRHWDSITFTHWRISRLVIFISTRELASLLCVFEDAFGGIGIFETSFRKNPINLYMSVTKIWVSHEEGKWNTGLRERKLLCFLSLSLSISIYLSIMFCHQNLCILIFSDFYVRIDQKANTGSTLALCWPLTVVRIHVHLLF